MKTYKTVRGDATAEDLISEVFSEIEQLADEIGSWRDGMSGTNLESSEKYQALDEAHHALTSVTMPEPDEWPQAKARIPYSESIPTRKKRQPSRMVRLHNAIMKVTAVIEFYESLDNPPEDLIGELREIEELEFLELPGMFS